MSREWENLTRENLPELGRDVEITFPGWINHSERSSATVLRSLVERYGDCKQLYWRYRIEVDYGGGTSGVSTKRRRRTAR